MAAPEFVPLRPNDKPRAYSSPPRRGDEWRPVRPGELVTSGGQPDADAGRMGAPGPDQGYLLNLVPLLRDELHLTDGEALADVEAGGVAVALKRESLFGRAPIAHVDLRDLGRRCQLPGGPGADGPEPEDGRPHQRSSSGDSSFHPPRWGGVPPVPRRRSTAAMPPATPRATNARRIKVTWVLPCSEVSWG